MSIIFTNADKNFLGLHTSCLAANIETVIWFPETKPVYDMLYEKKPKVVFIKSSHITPLIAQAFSEYKTKVVVLGKPLNILLQPDLWCIPEDATDYSLDDIHTKNKMILRKGANVVLMRNGIQHQDWISDILYISNDVVEEAIQLFDWIYPLPYKFISCGEVFLHIPNYLGTVETNELCNAIVSTKINIDYNNNSALDCAINKCFTLTNQENSIYPCFHNYSELVELIQKFIKDEKERRSIIKEAYNQVINNDTWFHRLKEIGQKIGFNWDISILEKIR